jgi:hypothetical protein
VYHTDACACVHIKIEEGRRSIIIVQFLWQMAGRASAPCDFVTLCTRHSCSSIHFVKETQWHQRLYKHRKMKKKNFFFGAQPFFIGNSKNIIPIQSKYIFRPFPPSLPPSPPPPPLPLAVLFTGLGNEAVGNAEK